MTCFCEAIIHNGSKRKVEKMARIPQYNRSVTPQNTPLGYINNHADPVAFGATTAQAMRGAADALGNAGHGILRLKRPIRPNKKCLKLVICLISM